MKKKHKFLSVMAALALAIFTFAAVPAEAGPLDNTSWLADFVPQSSSDISLLELDASGNGTGNFGIRQNMAFTYTFDQTANTGILVETSTLYKWAFTLSGNSLIFTNGMHPYSPYGVSQTFAQIAFQSSATLDDLTGTNWLGWTNRGETLLDNISYDTQQEEGYLDCTTGPYKPITGMAFSYIYNGRTGGTGTVTALGAFTAYNSTATIVFSNFMGLGPAATFKKFNYIP
jgi:hypothetical protein